MAAPFCVQREIAAIDLYSYPLQMFLFRSFLALIVA
jgi:hypothetical protein